MDEERLVARIERSVGAPGLVERLAGLPGSDLESLLLALHRRRTVSPTALLRAYVANRFVQPAPVDPAALLGLHQEALSVLPPHYQAVELSPVGPFGGAAALGAISQDSVLTAGRGTEVVSDPTIPLALECAARRRLLKGRGGRVDLFAAHRTVRGQPVEPPFLQHFSLIALCSAGRDSGGHAFDAEKLAEHIGFYLELVPEADVALTPLAGGLPTARLEERVVGPLSGRFPAARFTFDHERQGGRPGYYVRTCFAIRRDEWGLADGGFTDWGARLLSDRKERLLTSGLGVERLVPR